MQNWRQVQTFSLNRAFFMSPGYAPLRGDILGCASARLSVRKSRRKAVSGGSSDSQC